MYRKIIVHCDQRAIQSLHLPKFIVNNFNTTELMAVIAIVFKLCKSSKRYWKSCTKNSLVIPITEHLNKRKNNLPVTNLNALIQEM